MANEGASGSVALVNLGDLAKPATILIEKVSAAVGGIAAPWQTVRVAKAEAKADIIRATARIAISEIEERALVRMMREEGRKQENIEQITAQAIPLLSAEAQPENIEDDWLTHFFDQARLVSDSEMQLLWSKLLAEQSNNPGSCTKRTITLFATLDKSDAHYFAAFCTTLWKFDGPMPLIYKVGDELYDRLGLSFENLAHLESIGLINMEISLGYMRNRMPPSITLGYFDKLITLQFPVNTDRLFAGKVMLTRVGAELTRICQALPSDEYFMSVLEYWVASGYIVSAPLNYL